MCGGATLPRRYVLLFPCCTIASSRMIFEVRKPVLPERAMPHFCRYFTPAFFVRSSCQGVSVACMYVHPNTRKRRGKANTEAICTARERKSHYSMTNALHRFTGAIKTPPPPSPRCAAARPLPLRSLPRKNEWPIAFQTRTTWRA